MQVVTARDTRCRSCGLTLSPLEHGWCARPRCRAVARVAAEERAKALDVTRRVRLARDAILAKARRALTDPVDFFELVLRDESTNRHVTVPPHQRVLLDFVTHPAHDKAVVIMPVGTGKTATCTGLGLWMAARNPSLRGMFVSATQEQAKKPLMLVRQLLESSPELRLCAPGLLPSRRAGEPWSDTAITVDRPLGIRDPTFVARGIES